MNDVRILAIRATLPASGRIQCGACSQALADTPGGLLRFVADAQETWKGWVRSVGWRPDAPGGLWEAAPGHGPKQPPLAEQLDVVPAIVECPACSAGNLLDPERLVLRPNQLVARAHSIVRHLARNP